MEIEGLLRDGGEKAGTLPRTVLDANIYVAAYLSGNPRSPNKELFRRWRAGEFVLLVSRAILKEVVENFDERHIDQQLTVDLIAHIMAGAEYVSVKETSVQRGTLLPGSQRLTPLGRFLRSTSLDERNLAWQQSHGPRYHLVTRSTGSLGRAYSLTAARCVGDHRNSSSDHCWSGGRTMKMLTIERDDLSIDVLFDMASEGTVLITRDNKPVFALVAVDEEDLQTWQLGQNQGFLALMQRSWNRLHTEGGVPLAEARQRLLAESRYGT